MKMCILNFFAAAIGGAIPLCLKFWLELMLKDRLEMKSYSSNHGYDIEIMD